MARHLAIGDIHGCITALTTLLEFVEVRPTDTIVTLGDYVDRGPDSRAVVDCVMELSRTVRLIPLRGNHEIMMLDARDSDSWREAWLRYGGRATLQSYGQGDGDNASFTGIPDSHMDFLENKLRRYYECDTHFFVHANADPTVELRNQSDAALFWQKYRNPEPHCSGKIMVCGHTVQDSGLPSGNGHSVCIDTWAYGSGWLSCLDVGTGTIWQANEAGERRRLMLDELI